MVVLDEFHGQPERGELVFAIYFREKTAFVAIRLGNNDCEIRQRARLDLKTHVDFTCMFSDSRDDAAPSKNTEL